VKEDASMDSVFMPFDKLFGTFPGVLKVAQVKAIHNKAEDGKKGVLTLTDDTQLSYDVLFVATGSSWEEFISLPTEKLACKAHIEGWRNKIRGAENIVIVGGGAVGIGMAEANTFTM
jgi:pyruvate/2-oxoglutarate dehydrogenase complex dihydrolipoamide dehydrogenase (E3) component